MSTGWIILFSAIGLVGFLMVLLRFQVMSLIVEALVDLISSFLEIFSGLGD
jgi:hypothetical protein